MDKVKAQAQNAAAQAKAATKQAQDKVGDMQLRRKADDAAKRLGYLVHKERTGGPAAGDEADKLVAEITDLERQIDEEDEKGAAPTTPGPSSSDATPGDFKL
ncbi:MAG TPA: hypothetical protein VHI71_01125 [Actinomycetota bacterium]|nr:hypothetical protein [Actinomycetota bacterium]